MYTTLAPLQTDERYSSDLISFSSNSYLFLPSLNHLSSFSQSNCTATSSKTAQEVFPDYLSFVSRQLSSEAQFMLYVDVDLHSSTKSRMGKWANAAASLPYLLKILRSLCLSCIPSMRRVLHYMINILPQYHRPPPLTNAGIVLRDSTCTVTSSSQVANGRFL